MLFMNGNEWHHTLRQAVDALESIGLDSRAYSLRLASTPDAAVRALWEAIEAINSVCDVSRHLTGLGRPSLSVEDHETISVVHGLCIAAIEALRTEVAA